MYIGLFQLPHCKICDLVEEALLYFTVHASVQGYKDLSLLS